MDDIEKLERLIENEPLYDLFCAKVSQKAAEIADQQASRLRTRTAIVSGLFVISLAGAFTLALEVARTSIEQSARVAASEAFDDNFTGKLTQTEFVSAVESIVSVDFEEIKGEITEVSDTLRLSEAISAVREGDGFTDDQGREVLDGLLSISGVDELSAIKVEEALKDVVTAFASAGRYDYIEELEAKYGELMLNEAEIVIVLVQSLGLDLVSTIADPNKLSGHLKYNWTLRNSQLSKYSNAARKLGYPEYPFPYILIIEGMTNLDDSKISALSTEIYDFEKDEVETAGSLFQSIIDGKWIRGGVNTEKGRMASNRAKNTINKLLELSDHELFRILAEVN